ncbi:hypothetical protein BKA69DRAFT_1063332 [Paraphysoderma sedebokerense]|nr:hypothetical protein BKA69DRAFT_1063332 [Paraphysoderma sedebokerense]
MDSLQQTAPKITHPVVSSEILVLSAERKSKKGRTKQRKWVNRELRFDGQVLCCVHPFKHKVSNFISSPTAQLYYYPPNFPPIESVLLATPKNWWHWITSSNKASRSESRKAKHYQLPIWAVHVSEIQAIYMPDPFCPKKLVPLYSNSSPRTSPQVTPSSRRSSYRHSFHSEVTPHRRSLIHRPSVARLSNLRPSVKCLSNPARLPNRHKLSCTLVLKKFNGETIVLRTMSPKDINWWIFTIGRAITTPFEDISMKQAPEVERATVHSGNTTLYHSRNRNSSPNATLVNRSAGSSFTSDRSVPVPPSLKRPSRPTSPLSRTSYREVSIAQATPKSPTPNQTIPPEYHVFLYPYFSSQVSQASQLTSTTGRLSPPPKHRCYDYSNGYTRAWGTNKRGPLVQDSIYGENLKIKNVGSPVRPPLKLQPSPSKSSIPNSKELSLEERLERLKMVDSNNSYLKSTPSSISSMPTPPSSPPQQPQSFVVSPSGTKFPTKQRTASLPSSINSSASESEGSSTHGFRTLRRSRGSISSVVSKESKDSIRNSLTGRVGTYHSDLSSSNIQFPVATAAPLRTSSASMKPHFPADQGAPGAGSSVFLNRNSRIIAPSREHSITMLGKDNASMSSKRRVFL